MQKTITTITTIARKLFYNKQTSVALVMAVGATAALGSYASANPGVVEVRGTDGYPVELRCLTASQQVAEVRPIGGAAPGTKAYQVIGQGRISCEVESGTLRRPAETVPGARTVVNFRTP